MLITTSPGRVVSNFGHCVHMQGSRRLGASPACNRTCVLSKCFYRLPAAVMLVSTVMLMGLAFVNGEEPTASNTFVQPGSIPPPTAPVPTTDEDMARFKRQLQTHHSRFPNDPAAFAKWQSAYRAKLAALLMDGGLPKPIPPDAQVINTKDYPQFTLRRVKYRSQDDRTNVLLLSLPKGVTRAPLLLALHGHEAPWGEADERAYTIGHADDFIAYFAQRGWAVLQPATMNHKLQHQGWTLQGEWTWDAMVALDYAATVPDVDMGRVAVCGLSTGGHLAMNVLALDDRVRGGVVGCVLSTWNHYHRRLRIPPHCDCGITAQLSPHLEQCDWAALAAPKPVQFQQGRKDVCFCPGADPKLLKLDWNIGVMPPAEYETMFAEIRRAYALAGKPAAVATKFHDGPHKVDNEMAFEWLNQWVCAVSHAAELYVAPDGNDTNAGTRAAPLKTLEGARDAIRKLKSEQPQLAGGATVWLRGGVYRIGKTFELDQRDSGTKDAPIVYRACEGEEVRLSGGRELDPAAFRPVSDPAILQRLPESSCDKVFQVDLKAQGISDFGQMHRRGFGRPYVNPGLELFFNDQPMRLARWPNEGVVQMGEVLDKGSEPRTGDFSNRGGKFTYDNDHPSRWTKANDIWLAGRFSYGYADDTIKVQMIDTEKKIITLAGAHVYGISSPQVYALNLLEEIDELGEWFLDRKTGMLYFWPPAPLEKTKIAVSLLDEPMVAMEGASYITFRELTFEVSRGIGVYIEHGTGNLVAGCTLRNLGVVAVCIGQGSRPDPRPCGGWSLDIAAEQGQVVPIKPVSRQLGDCSHALYANTTWDRQAGTNHGVVGCNIYNTGAGGVSLGGGDRKTLTPAGNYVLNCHIHDFNRLDRSYRAGVNIDGVGNRIAHCLIHNAPNNAILLWGNDHIVEYNEVHHVCLWVDDMGAFYTGRDPSQQGSVLRHNFFHHNGGHDGTSWDIYLDGGACGITAFGNVFYTTAGAAPLSTAFSINCGHDNVVRNNIFIDTPPVRRPSVSDSAWMADLAKPLKVLRLRKAVDVTKPPYATRYPKLANMFDPSQGLRRSNEICSNVSIRSGDVRGSGSDDIKDNFVTQEDPGFVDAAGMDFQLKPDSIVFTKIPGFEKIPFEKIGLYKDEYRKAVPPRAASERGPAATRRPVRDPKKN